MLQKLTNCARLCADFSKKIASFINIAGVLLILATISRPNNAGNFHDKVNSSHVIREETHFVYSLTLSLFLTDDHHLHERNR